MNARERKEYQSVVSHPFQVFNGIFLTLPLDGIRQTGLRVPLLQEACELGLEASQSPVEILEGFFQSQGLTETAKQILQQVTQGNIPPDIGTQLINSIMTITRTKDIEEIQKRIEAIEVNFIESKKP